jgi:hypothetical protein
VVHYTEDDFVKRPDIKQAKSIWIDKLRKVIRNAIAKVGPQFSSTPPANASSK